MATQVLKFYVNADNRQAIQAFGQVRNTASNVARNLAGVFGIGLGAAGVVSFGKKVIDAADQVNELAERFGVSTDFVQRFGFMAKQSGTNVEVLNGALRVMAKNLNTGAGEAIAFQLGLDFKKIKDLKPEDQFKVIAGALQKIEDSSKRTALATAIFGRGGSQLGEMIARFRELSAEAENQTFFTEEQIRAADEFGDSVARINQALMVAAADSGFIQWVADVTDRLEKTISLLKINDERTPQEDQGTSVTKAALKKAASQYVRIFTAGKVNLMPGAGKDGLFLTAPTQTEVVDAINRHREATEEMSKNVGAYP
jgi:hypothetical protein